MAKNKLFYCEYLYGCGIRAYKTLLQCRKGELRENGERNFKFAREATPEDINHVKMMGGYIPKIYEKTS